MNLLDKIKNKSAKIAVVGMGYVGLPLAVEKAKIGYTVVGIEENPVRMNKINNGVNYIKDVKDNELKELVDKKRLTAATSFEIVKECDVVIICVPTPLTKNKEPDISYIESVSNKLSDYIRKDMLVVLESTTYPGTTEEIILPKLTKSGLKVGEDFYLAYSPERVDPGNKRYTTKNTFKIVGGVTKKCLEMAKSFYDQTIVNVIPVSSPRVAEITKVFENIFRSVNIALVNELAQLCDRMNIDVFEVIDAASSKNFGFMPFYPGPGVGGHCIPVDPYYLAWKSKEYDIHTRFIELAGEINERMPYYVHQKLSRILNADGKCLKNSKIYILGVTYKKDVDDIRESPALKIIELLEEDKAIVNYNDPHVPSFKLNNREYVSKDVSDSLIADSDCVLVLTNHSKYNYEDIVKKARIVFDTRNATKNVKLNRERIVKL